MPRKTLIIHNVLYVGSQLFFTHCCFGRTGKEWRQFFPGTQQGLSKLGYVGLGFVHRLLVYLGKYDGQRDAIFTQPLDKLQVDALRVQPAVYEHKYQLQVFSVHQVFFYHFAPFAALGLAGFGIAITRQIYQVPLVIYQKMVDELGFTGLTRGLGQLLPAGEHIDQRGFTHIRAAYKGKLRLIGLGAFLVVSIADHKAGFFDHAAKVGKKSGRGVAEKTSPEVRVKTSRGLNQKVVLENPRLIYVF